MAENRNQGAGNRSRVARGRATQRIIAANLREWDIYPSATPVGPYENGRDIVNTPGVAIEAKARAGFHPIATMRQAEANSGTDIPIGICRQNSQGPATIDEWPTLLRLGDLRQLAAHTMAPLSCVHYPRRGYVPLTWIRSVRQSSGVPVAVINAKIGEAISDMNIAVIRWGDCRAMLWMWAHVRTV